VARDESDPDDGRSEAFLKLVTVNRREVMKTGLAVSALTASSLELPGGLAQAAESARPTLVSATVIVNGRSERVEVGIA
jgi:hypothetical protein